MASDQFLLNRLAQPIGRNRRCWLCFLAVGLGRIFALDTFCVGFLVGFFVGVFVGFFFAAVSVLGAAVGFFVATGSCRPTGAGVAAASVEAVVGTPRPITVDVVGAARPTSGAVRLDCPWDVVLPGVLPLPGAALARYSCHMVWMRAIWPSEKPVRHTSSV